MSFDFDAAERHLLAEADDLLPALAIARQATECLGAMVEGVTVPPAPDSAPPSYYAKSATLMLAVIALRTGRACMLVVSAGYMPEAHGLKRRLSEVHARIQAIGHDSSGQHARDWLSGRGPSTPTRLFGKFGSTELWKMYSWGAHADAQSVHQWLSVPLPDVHEEHTGIAVPPHHHEILSNAVLTEVAMECRDVAAAMVVARARTDAEIRANLAQVGTLDEEIDAMIARYYNRVPDEAGEG